MQTGSTCSETSRRHLIQTLALVAAVVAITNAQYASGWNDIAYHNFLHKVIRGEIIIRGAAALRGQGARGVYVSGSSFTAVFGATPTAGDYIFLAIGVWGFTAGYTTAVSQTGVTWTAIKRVNYGSNNSEVWEGVVGSGAGTTITITFNTNPSFAICDAYEYSAITDGSTDKTAQNWNTSGNTTTDSGTTATTTEGSEIWIASIAAVTTSVNSAAQSNPTNSFAHTGRGRYGFRSSKFGISRKNRKCDRSREHWNDDPVQCLLGWSYWHFQSSADRGVLSFIHFNYDLPEFRP